MRVLHIVSHFDLGGAERVALNIAESSNKSVRYYMLEVVRGKGEFSSSFIDEMKSNHISYFRSPICNNKLAIVLFPFWFIFILWRIKPDVIHTHTEIPDLSIYWFYCWTRYLSPKVRFVRTIHNTELWNNWKNIGKKVERFFQMKKANVAISLSTRQHYHKEFGESPMIIYNGLSYVPQRKFENLVNGKINILFAGRLEYQKGVNELIKVAEAFKDDERFVFHIVGNGSLKKEVMQSLNGQANIFFYDKIFGLSSFLSSFDFLFMPSNFEGLALMSIEAGFAKLPPIINACPGLEETLPHDWPLKVNGNNIDDYVYLFDKVLPVIDRNGLRSDANAFVINHFSLETMRAEYESLYNKVLDR